MRHVQFIVSGTTGKTAGIHRITVKKAIQTTAKMLMGTLYLPRLKGPFCIFLLVHIRRQKLGRPSKLRLADSLVATLLILSVLTVSNIDADDRCTHDSRPVYFAGKGLLEWTTQFSLVKNDTLKSNNKQIVTYWHNNNNTYEAFQNKDSCWHLIFATKFVPKWVKWNTFVSGHGPK